MQTVADRRARRRLRIGTLLFVLALAIPNALLVFKAYDQMKWESFRAQQLVAEELANRIDRALNRLVSAENARPIGDYGFFRQAVAGDPNSRSPLADLEANPSIPGLVGYFEIAPDGEFRSPLLPQPEYHAAPSGLSTGELTQRQERADAIKQILLGNRLVERTAARPEGLVGAAQPERRLSDQALSDSDDNLDIAPADAEPALRIAKREQAPEQQQERLSQAAFSRFKASQAEPRKRADSGQLDTARILTQLDESFANRSRRELKQAADKAYAETHPAPALSLQEPAPAISDLDEEQALEAELAATPELDAVELFQHRESQMEVGLLNTGHLLLFRTVRLNNQPLIQGALIRQTPFLRALIAEPLANTVLARTTHLSVAYRGTLLASYRAEPGANSRFAPDRNGHYSAPLTGALLYRARLPEPFGAFELVFSVSRLPTPPGAAVIGWMAFTLALVLLVGAWLMYRLNARQLALVRQQQDFVSAVSHELKTPLTSIRLYAEMLRAGFAPEERKATYYRFIHEESERLSRLINNVLQLARIGRGRLVLEPRPVAVDELLAMVRERLTHQINRAGFKLDIDANPALVILADPDACVQILINLIDNALKFAANSTEKRIEIRAQSNPEKQVEIGVRDYGPGIPKAQRRRVFELFYRGEQAKTAAISGTGIGLALVHHLTHAMHGQINIIEHQPGVEFRLDMPSARIQPETD